MIVFMLCLAIHSAIAAIPMTRQDPMLVAIDDIAGLLYEVPEYEDPELIEHQLEHSLGGMPVFTLLELAKNQGNFKDEAPEKGKIAETKKAIDDIIKKLQETRSKLDEGFDNVYSDIQKSIQNLKKLERGFRPDVRQLLRTVMSLAKPLVMPETVELVTTKRPVTDKAQQVTEVPEAHDQKALNVRVISSYKSVVDESAKPKQAVDVAEASNENPKVDDKSLYVKSADAKYDKSAYVKPVDDKSDSKEAYEKPTEETKEDKSAYEISGEDTSSKASDEKSIYIQSSYSKYPEDHAPKSQLESDTYKKRNKKFEDTEQMTLFQPKWTWKSEQIL